jgi:hypothetical protein
MPSDIYLPSPQRPDKDSLALILRNGTQLKIAALFLSHGKPPPPPKKKEVAISKTFSPFLP